MSEQAFALSQTRDDDLVVVQIAGQIDSTNAAELGERLRSVALDGLRAMVLDLGKLAYLTSAGFRTLLIAQDEVADRGAALALCNLNDTVRDLFEMGGLADVFEIFGSLDEVRAKR